MSLLKDEIERDIAGVFLSEDDFGEKHTINDKEVVCFYAADTTLPLAGAYRLGITDSGGEIYVKTSDLGYVPQPADALLYDDKLYTVDDTQEDMGLLRIRVSKAERR